MTEILVHDRRVRSIFILAVCVITLAISPLALAETFNYTFTSTNANIVATGTLTGSLSTPDDWWIIHEQGGSIVPDEYTITGGTIDVAFMGNEVGSGIIELPGGAPTNGSPLFLDGDPYGGGTTQLIGEGLFFLTNPIYDPTSTIQLFQYPPPRYGPNNYNIFDATSGVLDNVLYSPYFENLCDVFTPINGTFIATDTTATTPEPPSFLLLGTGLFGLAVIAFRKAKPSI